MENSMPAVQPRQSFIPQPQNFEEAWKIASMLASSDLVPKDYKGKPENVCVAMQWGADIGLPGLQALQNIAVINGRPSIWGDAAKALVLASPACDDIQESIEGVGDERTAICVAIRRGKTPSVQRFSVADAKRAGLWNKTGPWQSYPDRMLQMRARGFALRDAFPDVLKGLMLAEEAQDIPDAPVEKNMGNATTVNDFMPKPKSEGGAAKTEETKALPASVEHDRIPDRVPEDKKEEVRQSAPPTESATSQRKAPPQAQEGGPVPTLTEGMLRVIRVKIDQNNKNEAEVAKAFGVQRLEDIPTSSVNDVIAHIGKA